MISTTVIRKSLAKKSDYNNLIENYGKDNVLKYIGNFQSFSQKINYSYESIKNTLLKLESRLINI